MRYAFFPGCKIPYFLESYGRSGRAVLEALGVTLVDLEFNCCGYPVRHLSDDASLVCAARNLAIAEDQGLDLLTPCKCCFGNLKRAQRTLRSDGALRGEITHLLQREGLEWRGKAAVRHLLSVLAEDIGLESIKARIVRPYHRLAVAAHYGCHALRPGRITQFDNPLAPTVFERLIAVTGAVPVVWSRRLECCGAPLWEKNEAVSLTLMRRKLADARRAGASCLCTACTYCQIQFETVQADHPDPSAPSLFLPSLVYTHLLGPALGISPEMLGMQYDPSEPRTVLRTQSG